jgi:hypothetical protein
MHESVTEKAELLLAVTDTVIPPLVFETISGVVAV